MTIQALDLKQFLALSWSPAQLGAIQDRAARPDIQALVAWDNAGRLSCSAYTGEPSEYPARAVAIWRRTNQSAGTAVRSKTMQALDLILQEGLTPYAAAQRMNVHPSAVYRALDRAQQKTICPCCKQVVREGFEIDRSVLKDPAPAPNGA